MVQKERKAGYFLALGLFTVMFLGVSRVQAASVSKLVLFNFETASDMKIANGTKLDLAGDNEASAWTSGNPKVVKVSKKGIAAVSAGATVYFDAAGVFQGKETSFPCVAVFTNDYEHEQYDYAMMLQPVIWVADDGQLLCGAGMFWYA